MNRKDSFFIVIDGIDGAGKEVARDAAAEFFRQIPDGATILNLDNYWNTNHRHPQFEQKRSEKGEYLLDYVNPEDIDIILSSEPTYTDIGNAIRNEIVRYKGRYSAKFTAEMFAADRQVLYKRVLLPAIELGKIWIQCRSFSTSVVYQQQQAKELNEQLSLPEILSLEGNQLAMQNPPNLLIIPTVKDVEKVLVRTKKRKKDDNTWFEKVDFQKKLEEKYESKEFREFFEKLGTKVVYVDGQLPYEEYQTQIKTVLSTDYKK